MKSNEIVFEINRIIPGTSRYLKSLDAFAVVVEDKRGLAVKVYNDIKIDETFNNMGIKTEVLQIGNDILKVVFLYTTEKFVNEHYGFLCLDFTNDENRNLVTTEPLKWFKEWKDLLGNYSRNCMVYDVVGEMSVLLELQRKGKNPVWNSTQRGTYDITCDDGLYEVKTTKSKTHNVMTVHNHFQLDDKISNLPLYIAYCKLEENVCGVSIDDLYNELISNGFNQHVLDEYLNELKYYKGKDERYQKYTINEIRLYTVDDNFPKITHKSISDTFKTL